MQTRLAKVNQLPVHTLLALNHGQPYAFNQVTPPITETPLLISFQPAYSALEFTWQRPVTSKEYRECMRFIGLCIAILRVKYLLVDFSKMGNPSPEDQHLTESFLRKALKHTTLVRSARVIARSRLQQNMYEAVINSGIFLPYETKAFHEADEARKWLLRNPFSKSDAPDCSVVIPHNASLKELKKFATAEAVSPDVVVPAETITENPETKKHPVTRCQTSFVEVIVDRENSYIVVRWLRKVTSREYRYGVLKAGRALINSGVRGLISNNQRLQTLTLQDQAWLTRTASYMFGKSKVERVAFITSADMMQQMALESVLTRVQQNTGRHQTQYFFSESDALQWVRDTH